MATEREMTHLDDGTGDSGAPFARTEIRGGPSGSFFAGAGLTILGAAVATAILPRIAPGQSGLVETLAGLGVTAPRLFAAGSLLTLTWMAIRTTRAHSIAAQYAAISVVPSVERVSDDVNGLREVLHGLRMELGNLKGVLHAHIERQNATPTHDANAEGIFRLAASLDQLGHRVEEQISASQRQLREMHESVSSAIEVLRHERRDGRIHLGDDAGTAIEVHATTAEVHDEPASHAPDDAEHHGAHEPAHGPAHPAVHEPAHEHPHEHAHEHGRDRTREHEPAVRSESLTSRERLGVLDLLDDLGRMLPKKPAAPPAERALITADAFEGVQDEGWDRHDVLAAPLPSIRIDPADPRPRIAGLLAGPTTPAPTDDAAIVRKLEELRSLLSDSRVREALTSMEHLED